MDHFLSESTEREIEQIARVWRDERRFAAEIMRTIEENAERDKAVLRQQSAQLARIGGVHCVVHLLMAWWIIWLLCR